MGLLNYNTSLTTQHKCVLRGNEQWQRSTRLVNRFSIRLQIPLTHSHNTVNCSTAKETKEAEDKSCCLSVEQQKETTAMAGIFHPQPQRQENKKKKDLFTKLCNSIALCTVNISTYTETWDLR